MVLVPHVFPDAVTGRGDDGRKVDEDSRHSDSALYGAVQHVSKKFAQHAVSLRLYVNHKRSGQITRFLSQPWPIWKVKGKRPVLRLP